jgi:RNA polymerase sigma-70 factor (ECF subfamily)
MQSDSEFAELLDRVRRDDKNALETLLGTCRAILRQRARGQLGRRYTARVDTSDVVQETMTQAFQNIQNFRGQTRGEWMAWLQSILAAKARRLRRRHRAEKRSVAQEAPHSAILAVERAREVKCLLPDQQLLEVERRTELTRALEQLPEPMSEVIVRRIFLQQQFDEVATALNRSPGATRVLWTRAVRKLREILPLEFFPDREIPQTDLWETGNGSVE